MMNTELKKIQVIIVDDEEETLDLLATILKRDKEIELMASYTNAEDAVVGILKHQPDMVIMDINLPGISGVAAVVQVKVALQKVHFLMYTAFEDKRLADAIIAGADGYILKHDSSDAIIPAIKSILAGDLEMNPHITRMAMEYFTQKNKQIEHNYTPEEVRLMRALANGLGNKQIAPLENNTEGGIKQKLFKLFKKAQVKNRAEMVKIYLESIE
ncbi:MAG TPA: response regulator transcription factor [Haliscomenobacter sp.]|uniref:response regulator n=1 Tax=Haliscomenobacter sp. TaxID=2717303 RepID=UPI002C92C3DD|nr:response regulator transcription factor [Haliscomenobacter sp.]HOY18272.1 response regulator transcription factor [Haliscomenobacter sp.]